MRELRIKLTPELLRLVRLYDADCVASPGAGVFVEEKIAQAVVDAYRVAKAEAGKARKRKAKP